MDRRMTRVIAFDVNETLLDLRALDPIFERTLGDKALRPQWFQTMLQLAFVGTITGQYVDFTRAQHAALRVIGARGGLRIDAATADEIVGGMRPAAASP